MRAILSKIATRRAIGISLGEHDVAVVKVASTPAGPVETDALCEPCTPENVDDVIERLLVPLLGRNRRVPVAVGITSSRLYFGARIVPAGAAGKPESELRKALSTTSLSDDMIVDTIRGTANKTPVARMVACRRKYVSSLVTNFNRLGIRPIRTEPSPWALVRLAERQHRAPRWSKTVLRIFLGPTTGLVVAISGGMPFGWKNFILPPGSEGFAIVSAVRGFTTQQAHYGIEAVADYAIIHGRPDLHEQLQQEELPSTMGTRVIWHEGPPLDSASIASGLALGGLMPDVLAFDLSRTLKTRAPIKEIFPWGELIFASTAMGLMGLVLGVHAMKLDEAYTSLRTENSQHTCLSTGDAIRLERDRKALEDKIAAMRNFTESRILWTTYTRDISERIPSNADLNTFNGRNALDYSGKSRAAAGGFELRGTAPLAEGGAIPKNIETFLNALARDPLWARDFATILTEIKLPPVSKDKRASAFEQPKIDFSILCAGRVPGDKASGPDLKATKEVKVVKDSPAVGDKTSGKESAADDQTRDKDSQGKAAGPGKETKSPLAKDNADQGTKKAEDNAIRENAK